MATINLTLFGRKPKPPKPAVSPAVRAILDKKFKGHTVPSVALVNDYRRYTEIKNNRAG